MVQPGQEMNIQIENLGFQGEGICRVDGFVVFVPFSLPGENVTIKIESVKKNHATASVLEILEPSGDRIAPKCPVFGRCGGCFCQHLPYPLQLQIKREGIADNFKKIAGSRFEVSPVIGMEEPWKYRNKTTWQIVREQGRYRAGFFVQKSREVIAADWCAIASDASNKAIRAILSYLNDQSVEETSPIKQVVTRTGYDGKLMLLLYTSGEFSRGLRALTNHLQAELTELESVHALRDNDTKAQPFLLYGNAGLNERIGRLGFSLSPLSFYQVNHDIMNRMYAYAVSQSIQEQNGTLIDIYSGIGTISMLAAEAFNQVIGLELSASSVADAGQSASLNGLTNVSFIEGYAEKELPKLLASGLKVDAVILDPPRKGADEKVLSAILAAKPDRLVYISCHPASQARDLPILQQGGYEAVASQPFDMFPQTAEIENVLTMKRRTV